MSYTFISAYYADEGNTSAVATTSEAGQVLLSAMGTPSDWADLLAWDAGPGTITPFTPNYAALRAQKIQSLLAYENTLRDGGATWPSPTGDDKPYRIRRDFGDIEKYNTIAMGAIAANTYTDGAHTAVLKTWVDPGDIVFSAEISPAVATLDTKEKAFHFAQTMLEAHRAVAEVSYAKQAEIAALPDNEATIAAYDVTAGWPVI